jgi:DNA repair protein RecO (recombination protein O)
MLTKSRAIVLRTVRYGDKRMMVDMLTEQYGRLSFSTTIGSSARSRQKKLLFQPLSILEVVFDYRQSQQVQRLGEARIWWPSVSLHFDSYKMSLVFFLSEFLYYVTRDEQENVPLFEYIVSSLAWLDSVDRSFSNFHLVFMMQLSRYVGFLPNLDNYTEGDCFDLEEGSFCHAAPYHGNYLEPTEAARIALLMRLRYETMHLCAMSRRERNRCTEVIVSFYRLHVPGFAEMKSLAVVQDLFV